MRLSTDHLVAEWADERKAIVEDLESQTGPIKDLLGESRETLTTAQLAAQAINEGITSLDSFVARWDKDPGATTSAPASPAAAIVAADMTSETDSPAKKPPFNVNDYGAAAGEIAVAAAELRGAIHSLEELIASPGWEERMPEIAGLIGQVRADGEDWLDHAFRLGLVLMVVFFVGAMVTMLCYRYLAKRLVKS